MYGCWALRWMSKSNVDWWYLNSEYSASITGVRTPCVRA